GEYVAPLYRLDRADVIVALDADFLACGHGALRYAREFSARRRPDHDAGMNRLYAIESTTSPTGARADHRFGVRPTLIEPIARALAAAVGVPGLPAAPAPADVDVAAIARDLLRHRGASLVIAGDTQPPVVHALAHAMNDALGNAVYTAPADLDFARAMTRVTTRIHLSLYEDETSELCQWHIPQAHFLEAWSDSRADDGTAAIVQPLIMPLYGGKSAHELLAALSDQPERSGHDIVREYWRRTLGPAAGPRAAKGARPASRGGSAAGGAAAQAPDEAFERMWRRWLHDGVIAGTAFQPRSVTLRVEAARLPSP